MLILQAVVGCSSNPMSSGDDIKDYKSKAGSRPLEDPNNADTLTVTDSEEWHRILGNW